ncbi:stress-associated endoplasmic reticulum 2-like [Olea europaea subsp. europaea]|uniref:Stress-associated endoplasmic reticulum 2-like n=1 Tax=Olea europaea subsp. europaea TaxID=158383 RepID=A0A8S0Q602_OLEEU|nr:stress-associated endoplasmic reticulum 2-like [Olea europaea subsp. europaea]
MTTSKRLAEKKTAKFEKNITRRGLIPQSSKKEEWEPAHIVLVLFAVLVVLSFVYQVVRMAINGGMY